MTTDVQTAESAALQKFVAPVDSILAEFTKGKVIVRSDVQLQRACDALAQVRGNRKALAAYFKEDPGPATNEPGRGLCYFMRRAWEQANSLFNKFDSRFAEWDSALDKGIKEYRAEQERRAREEADRIASEERKRLAAEAKKLERKAPRAAAELRQEAERVQPIIREIAKPEGYSARKVWRAECVDFARLVKAVADGRAPLSCLEINQSALNKLADAFGGNNPSPGVRFYQDQISSTRRDRG